MQTIKEIQKSLLEKKISAKEIAEDYLKKASRAQKNGSVLLAMENDARTAAAEIDQKIARGEALSPVAGCPLGIKDIFNTKNVRTTAGSRILENYISFYESTVTDRLRKAGAIPVSKLNMDEFAMGSSNENSAYGVVKNPWDLKRVPGGSSGGSAAAVAEGSAVVALGTDTGGSIRLPAHFCGIAGMKPTYGRCSRFGMIAFASSLDQAGPMARSVEDLARTLDVMAGPCHRDSTTVADAWIPTALAVEQIQESHVKGLRVGLVKEFDVGGCEKGTQKTFEEIKNQLIKKGAQVVEVSLPSTQASLAVYYVIAMSEASSNLSRFDGVRFGHRTKMQSGDDLETLYSRSRGEGFGAEVKRRIILGTYALSAGYYDAYYVKACRVRARIRKDFEEAFKKCDVLLTPVATDPAFELGSNSDDPIKMYLNDIFTIPASLAGLPAMVVPVGMSGSMPIGIQLIGPGLKDREVLQAGRAIELLSGEVYKTWKYPEV